MPGASTLSRPVAVELGKTMEVVRGNLARTGGGR